ncbi:MULTISPECIES: zinc-binding alcohol dehydrogenase family protein [Fictibacillus]|uniref:Alcohol dehydrogenase n=1 Tax=Fictibacillus enclensis TaxID=1017270 RepID=A0A0V8J055_9BACL|nr:MULTISPECIES: zinc-binding alcohol dehydrogenase family protein [Fictibacillus]KSU80314.1 alcohol dehydrogenase [Fictibacillus enclensis]RXZ01688.1 alcohol dehydrogenase [Fictibacillus sp. S7]SCC37942.1 hypothetical protein GA0061096_4296 [Fictibacillus enclensis]
MKGIICEEPNAFKQIEVEKPVPMEGEALIRIRRVGICGTDLHAFSGNQPYFTYPRILGHELSGVIESIGANPFGYKEGDQVSIIPYLECGTCVACRNGKTNCCTDMKVLGVHADGGMREWMAVPVDHLIKTEGLSLDEAAMIEPLSIGAHAVRRSRLREGENVLVIGAGPIGLGVMAFAKAEGARVFAMDLDAERLNFCQKWADVDGIVNAADQPIEKLMELTNGELPTVVLDATGNARSMMGAFDYAAHGGTLVYVGLVKSDLTFSDPDFHKKELTLMGSRNATREDFDKVLNTVKSGEVDLKPYITHRSSLDEMISDFDGWLKPESKVIKAIVEF